MFDDAQEPKDMFADVPDPSAQQKKTAQPTVAAPQPQIISPASAMQYSEPKSGGAGLRLIAVILISLVCIGGAGYAAYRFMVKDAVSQQVSDVIEGGTESTDDETDTTTNTTPVPDTETDTETDVGPTAVVDSDGDGLSNEEERIVGTSVTKPDTDRDGLGDREEVKKYDTDPKKADTDGDGYDDGAEVENGYNPNGEGRLLEIPE
ncbi:MAG: hypothetical protein AAB448_04140 [Patescibacteria group bacterium]